MPTGSPDYGDIRIAHRIVSVRLDRGMTISQFASALGVSQPTQSRIEQAKRMPDAAYLLALHRVFNIDINELLESSEMARKATATVRVTGNHNVVAGRDISGKVSVVKARRKA